MRGVVQRRNTSTQTACASLERILAILNHSYAWLRSDPGDRET